VVLRGLAHGRQRLDPWRQRGVCATKAGRALARPAAERAGERAHLSEADQEGHVGDGGARVAEVREREVTTHAVEHRFEEGAPAGTHSVIENDEVWSYVKKKQARVTPAEDAAGLGESYTFTALAMLSRCVVTWMVGKRDETTANAFVADLRSRLVVSPSLVSDGLSAYPAPIAQNFGYGVAYAQTVKNYRSGGRRDNDRRYEPPCNPFITKRANFGAPDLDKATTAHNERNNGTMRHKIGRMRRLCYAFSKSPEHHKAAVALGYCAYNLTHVLRTTRLSLALAAGVTDHLWELEELLDALPSVPETPAPIAKPLACRTPEGSARASGRSRMASPPPGREGRRSGADTSRRAPGRRAVRLDRAERSAEARASGTRCRRSVRPGPRSGSTPAQARATLPVR